MKILFARHSGFCFGVKRAMRMAQEAARASRPVYSLGPLIHNPQVVADMEKAGIITVNDMRRIKGKKVMIRSHGLHPDVLHKLTVRHCAIIDATCPKVRRAQLFAAKLARQGYYVIIVGEKNHPEVRGLLGYAGVNAEVYRDGMVLKSRRIGVVPQTTMTIDGLNRAVARMMPDVLEMKIYNTICQETTNRIHAAQALARKVDVMIVVGGKNSANTTRLYEVCKAIKPSYHVERARELKKQWFRNATRVGITAGASTPQEQLQAVVDHLKEIA